MTAKLTPERIAEIREAIEVYGDEYRADVIRECLASCEALAAENARLKAANDHETVRNLYGFAIAKAIAAAERDDAGQ